MGCLCTEAISRMCGDMRKCASEYGTIDKNPSGCGKCASSVVKLFTSKSHGRALHCLCLLSSSEMFDKVLQFF